MADFQRNPERLAIETRNLSRFYSERKVIDSCSFTLPLGQSLALLGPNGSGKTTLLRVLGTLLLPSAGEGWVLGHSLSSQARLIRAEIGWVSASDRGFVSRLSGYENLLLFGRLKGLSTSQVLSAIESWKKINAVESALKTPFYECSTGMRQSLGIVRALLGNPWVVFLDEPTRSLDQQTARSIRESLADFKKGRTLVFATHSDEESEVLGDQTLRFEGGKLT